MKTRRFDSILNQAVPAVDQDDPRSPIELEVERGYMVLLAWIQVARWYMPDRDIADLLRKHATELDNG